MNDTSGALAGIDAHQWRRVVGARHVVGRGAGQARDVGMGRCGGGFEAVQAGRQALGSAFQTLQDNWMTQGDVAARLSH